MTNNEIIEYMKTQQAQRLRDFAISLHMGYADYNLQWLKGMDQEDFNLAIHLISNVFPNHSFFEEIRDIDENLKADKRYYLQN